MRSSHQGLASISSTQACEVFQSSCTSWSSKIIADADRREQPADRRVAPRLPVEARVLLEVQHLLVRRLAGVAARADELARLRRVLVGIDLVADRRAARAATPRAACRACAWRARRARRSRARARDPRPWSGSTAARAEPRRGRSRTRSSAAVPGRPCGSTLGGMPSSGSGQRRSPSSATSYSYVSPGSRPVTGRARSGGPRRGTCGCERPSSSTSQARVGLDPDGRRGLVQVAEHGPQDQLSHGRKTSRVRSAR